MPQKPKKNYDAVDVAKLFFCICIVITHTKMVRYLPQGIRGIVNAVVVRASVPFFFVASGFFLYLNVQARGAGPACKKYVTRMLQPLIIFETIGELLFIAFKLYQGTPLSKILVSVRREVIFYPRASMWFLQACIVGCILLYFFYRMKTPIIVPVLIGCALFSFALLANNYRFVADAIGMGEQIDLYLKNCISPRNGLFYGFLFMALGGAVAEWRLTERLDAGTLAILLAAAFVIYELEAVLLRGTATSDDGSLFISQAFAIPLLFTALCRIEKRIACSDTCRRYSTGIYYLQKIVLYMVESAFIILGRDLPPIVAFTTVMVISTLICFISYRHPRVGRYLQ